MHNYGRLNRKIIGSKTIVKNTIDYIYSKGLYNEIKSIFNTTLPYAVIKGKPLSVLIYNNVHERFTTDLDILCPKNQYKKIVHMLNELGFTELNKSRYDILFSKSFPVICISYDDENYIRSLFGKIYGVEACFESLQNGNVPDKYGIRWQYQKSSRQGIFYCLSFDGFCSDVVAFYENTFKIKATEVIKYSDSPYSDKLTDAHGADKIYSAILEFSHDNCTYSLKLSDTPESAIDGVNRYDANALLFYRGQYNPVITLKDNDGVYLSEAFKRLMSGAKLNRPMMPTNDGITYGSLIDKYGICWNLYSGI